jgi:MFS family permease
MNTLFRSMSSPMYRIWFVGALFSNLGTWMQMTVQNWVVLDELTEGSAIAVAVTIGLQMAPQLLLSPWSGVLADRVLERRRILMVTQSIMMILGVTLGLLLLFGVAELWHVFAFALLFGCTNAFDAPARQAMIGDIVSREHLTNAVALNSAVWNTARLIGPALAGVLIVVIGSGLVFIVNGLTFMLVILMLVLMRSIPARERPERGRFWSEAGAGFRYVTSRPDLVAVFLIAFVMGGWGMNSPIFTSTMSLEYGRGAAGYGFLLSIFAVGAVLAALLAARRPGAEIRVITMAAGGYFVFSVIAALMPTYEGYALVTIVTGFTIVTTMITSNSYVQHSIDPSLRGRVMALYMACAMGGAPLGALTVGTVADLFGARWSVGVGAAAGAVCCAIGVVSLVTTARRLRALAVVPKSA